MENNVAWSFSALTQFETCPKQYYHYKVAKDIKDFGNEKSNYGQDVHKALELRLVKGKKLPMDMQHHEPIIQKIEATEGTKLGEQKLALNNQFQPTGWFDSDAWVRAVLDVAVVNNPTAFIGDYKTGKIKNDFTQLTLSAAIFSAYEPEITEYRLAYLWLGHKQISSKSVSRRDLLSVWNDILPRQRRLADAVQATEFPARPNYLCKKYCGIKSCPHNGQSGT